MSPKEIIKKLKLEPLPMEGGFYAETYRSEEWFSTGQLPSRYNSKRSFYTAIYYLLTPETFSALHKLSTDEVFHFYLGDPVQMLNLFEDGTSKLITLGQDIFRGQTLQYQVPKGTWQGSRLLPGGSFALLGTTMAPGFDFEDFTAADHKAFSGRYTEHQELIRNLTIM